MARKPPQPIEIQTVYNSDAAEGHRAHMAALQLLIEIILDNDAKYGVPEKVDAQSVA